MSEVHASAPSTHRSRGRAAANRAAARALLALLLPGALPAGLLAQTIAGKTVFVPLPPCRVIDTRQTAAGPLVPGAPRDFSVTEPAGFADQGGFAGSCGIPQGSGTPQATAIAVNSSPSRRTATATS